MSADSAILLSCPPIVKAAQRLCTEMAGIGRPKPVMVPEGDSSTPRMHRAEAHRAAADRA